MLDIEIVIFNDKSWVRLTEYQKLEEQLAKRICELQSDLSKAKTMIEKMRTCYNCKYKNSSTEKCEDCVNKCKWELAE